MELVDKNNDIQWHFKKEKAEIHRVSRREQSIRQQKRLERRLHSLFQTT